MSAVMLITTNKMLLLIILLISSIYFTMEVPICYNCDSSCNDTVTVNSTNNLDFNPLNRSRRRSEIMQHSCYEFQLELILIPLSIALIPFGLCALLFCVCFCGPKESRGKTPKLFQKKAKIDAKDANEIDNDELTCKNGIIMRRNSKKIRFSTAISFIEANYGNNSEIIRNDQSIIPIGLFPIHNEKYIAEKANIVAINMNKEVAAIEQILVSEKKLENEKENDASESDRLPSRINTKHARFSDEIDILGELKSNS